MAFRNTSKTNLIIIMIGGLKNLYLFNIIIIVVPLKATKPEIKQPVSATSPDTKRTQWNAIQKAISSSSRRQKHPSQKASLTSDRLKRLRCGSYYQDTVCTLGEDPEPREPVELRMLMVSDV